MMQRSFFLGYPVDNLTMPEALSWIANAVESGKSRTIAVINANKLWLAHRDARLADFLKHADLVIPEYAVVWGARRLGRSLSHLGGISLLQAFLPFAEKHGLRPYFLGARPHVLDLMTAKLKEVYPRLPLAGGHHGYFDDASKKLIIEDLEKKKPDILFVALGSPKQELFISELQKVMGIPVMVGVGGSFDVLAGLKKDAPSWARGRGWEWIYRICQDPLNTNYYKRYLITNFWFLFQVFKEKVI
jgi:N-acetylglucosaminyldiphosphoundecaprenol N-acetyl-beta-D-mannosaminyltransferase